MGLLGKGLLGLLLGGGNKNSMPSYLKNAPASYHQPGIRRHYACAYCGRKTSTTGSAPTAAWGGTCKYSPHSRHYWESMD